MFTDLAIVDIYFAICAQRAANHEVAGRYLSVISDSFLGMGKYFRLLTSIRYVAKRAAHQPPICLLFILACYR
jgi:hypothetical protein